MPLAETSIEMWATLALALVAIGAYATERIPIEVTALGVLGALLLMFHLFPLLGVGRVPGLGPEVLLRGFASPALIAVSALLVVGQAMVNTGALDGIARLLIRFAGDSLHRASLVGLAGVGGMSAVLNNTPIVVIFIPVFRALAERYRAPTSALLMPLSFAAILGGMLTLIGSSSNLLVSGELTKLGYAPLGFFDLTIPGLVLALVGGAYVLLLPTLLPLRQPPEAIGPAEGRQFIAEIDVLDGSPLIGETTQAGLFPRLPGVTVRLIQRGARAFLPPFEGVELASGDVLIVAATRKVLADLLADNAGQLLRGPDEIERPRMVATARQDLVLVEAMIRPASRMVGQTLHLTNFAARAGLNVIGIQRRARMVRARLHDLRLEPGDVLLLFGPEAAVATLRADPDVILMEWSASEMPSFAHAPVAALIFAGIIVPAALGWVPIVISAVLGVVALIATGCINVRQAARAVDRRIVLLVASALALGTALEATGGAAYLATGLLELMAGASNALILSGFFLVVALLTNILSNNACAVLFTPVAIEMATRLGVDAFPFALAVVFAANCSFATPIGYQTNLLVMGPGRYRFSDFVVAGLPLLILVWLTFSLFVPWYYGL